MLTNVTRPSAVDVLRPFAVGDQFYADTTSTLAKRAIGTTNQVYTVSGGVPAWSSSITVTSLTVVDSGFTITGSSDATKALKFEVDAQTANDTLTIDTGAQTDSRTATFPVLTGNSTFTLSNATLTSGRIPYATTNGLLTDSANLTFSGTLLTLGTGATGGLSIAATTGATLNIASTSTSNSPITGAVISQGSIVSLGTVGPFSGYIITATNFSSGLNLYKRGATGDSTAAVASGGEIAYHSFLAWDGSAYARGAYCFAQATEAWTSSAHGTRYDIYTTPNGSTTNTACIRFESNQTITAFGTTEAASVSSANIVNQGGLGVAKRSYLGTIGASFKGNVNAGVQDATAAVAGQVGEVLSSTVTGVAVAASGTVGNVTSLSITAGDWLISGQCVISGGATGLTAGSAQKLSIVTTTATNGTEGDTMMSNTIDALTANGKHALSIPQLRINISSTTTYYLTEEVTYAGGSPTAAGKLIATRMR